MFTAPDLLAAARGRLIRGPYRCFFCGTSCGDDFPAAQYVADSFTERGSVAFPGSPFVCAGCVESMRSDLPDAKLVTGDIQRPKADSKRAGLQFRWFSWLITPQEALAATPAHRDKLLTICLSPPAPPFALCIADGNKHQLYRTPVNHVAGRVAVNCEGTRVDYHPDELRDRLDLTIRIVAEVGKGASSIARLMDPAAEMGLALQMSDAALLDEWRRVRNEPLSALALWLTPGKDDCRDTVIAPAA